MPFVTVELIHRLVKAKPGRQHGSFCGGDKRPGLSIFAGPRNFANSGGANCGWTLFRAVSRCEVSREKSPSWRATAYSM